MYMMTALTTATVVFAAALIAQMLWLGAQGDRSAPLLPKDIRKAHTLWGMFYVNPNDPRGWVPKTFGYGWTVNMRSRGHVYVFVVLILGALLSAIGTSVLATKLAG
jgi:uncharacterized membrane protein